MKNIRLIKGTPQFIKRLDESKQYPTNPRWLVVIDGTEYHTAPWQRGVTPETHGAGDLHYAGTYYGKPTVELEKKAIYKQ